MAKNYGTENKTTSKNEMNTRNAQDCGKNSGKNSVKNSSKNKTTSSYGADQNDYSDRY